MITDKEILKDSSVLRRIGRLAGITLFEAKSGYAPWNEDETFGVTAHRLPGFPDYDQKWWAVVYQELEAHEDRKHLPRRVFLDSYQVEKIMEWAKDLIVPVDDHEAAKKCTDCKGSGWYVGMVERYYCPTCDEAGKVAP